MKIDAGMVYLVTNKYEAMRRFFSDLGLDVKAEEGCEVVTPQLNGKRGCLIVLPSLMISLEESTDVPPSPLYIQLTGFDEARILALKGKYSVTYVGGFGGDFYNIKTPDGGIVMASPERRAQPA